MRMLQVCELFSTLAIAGGRHLGAGAGSSQNSGLRDDFQILLRKFTRSPEFRKCRIGIVGTIAFVKALAAVDACTDSPAAFRSHCLDSARDLLNNAFDACKLAHPQHRPALFSCLCNSLSAAISEVGTSRSHLCVELTHCPEGLSGSACPCRATSRPTCWSMCAL